MFWVFGEFCLMAFIILFIVSQIIIPPVIGKRFFWLFRKEEKKINEAEEEYFKVQLEEQSEKIKYKTEDFKLAIEKERREREKKLKRRI